MFENLDNQPTEELKSEAEAPEVTADQEGEKDTNQPAEAGQESEEAAELVLNEVEGDQERPESDRFKPSQGQKQQRLKQRAKLKRAQDEASQLRAELEQLKQRVEQPAAPAEPEPADKAPTLESCGYDESAYQQQLTEYLVNKQQSIAVETANKQIQQTEQQRQVDRALNAHYDRAEKLNIPDYAEREQLVRQVLSDKGTESLIAALGAGSEKVIGYLGANPDQLETFNQIANANPLEALAYAGSLKERLNLSRKKPAVSKAPQPSEIPGGGQGNANDPRERLVKLREKDFAKFAAEKDAFIRSHGVAAAKKAGYIR